MPLGLGHTLTNPFLEKFYQKFKKLLKLFQFLIKFFPKMVHYYVPLGHTLVKSIYIYRLHKCCTRSHHQYCFLRAFSSTIVKILAFTISKHYFYNFNTSFYNILNIKTSIFFTTSFKNYFFIIFYSFFVFIFFILSLSGLTISLSLPLGLTISPSWSHCLSLFVSLSQPSNHTHHRPLATQFQRPSQQLKTHADETHADQIDQVDDPRRSTQRSTPVTLMIHERRPMNPDP